MAILARDTFTRTNASSWGNADSPVSAYTTVGTAVYSTTGVFGEILAGANVTCFTQLACTHDTVEVVGKVMMSDVTDQCGFCVRYTDSNNYYLVNIKSGSGGLRINRKVAGTSTDLLSYTFATVAGTWYWLRMRVEGSTLSAKYWVDGSTEPSSWRLQTTDTNFSSGSYIACRHLATVGTTYSGYDDYIVTDFYAGVYSLEVCSDDTGSADAERTDTSGTYTLNDAGTLTTGHSDTMLVGTEIPIQSGIGEVKGTDTIPLTDSGSVVQVVAAVTESIVVNAEILLDALSTSGEKKDVSMAFATDATSLLGTISKTLSYPLADVPATTAIFTDSTLEAFMDTTPALTGTRSFNAEVVPLSDSMTQETDISKNIFLVLAESLLPPLEEDTSVESLLLIESAGIHTLYYTVASSDVMVAVDPLTLDAVYESIDINSNVINATERVSGDSTNAPVTTVLTDAPGLAGTSQLQESLALIVASALSKELQQLQQLVYSDTVFLEKNFLEAVFNILLTDDNQMITVQTLLDTLPISDITLTNNEKIFYENNPVTETNGRTEEEKSISGEALAIATQVSGSQGATVGIPETFTDASSYSTGMKTDTTSNQLSYQQALQRETATLLAGMVQVILQMLGTELSMYTVPLEGTGNVTEDVSDALKRYVVWKTPAMQVAWSTPLTTLVVATPAMQCVWATPTMVIKWNLVE